MGIGVVDACGGDVDQKPAGCGYGVGDFDRGEDFGTAEAAALNGEHVVVQPFEG
jgi:hypothetical protein